MAIKKEKSLKIFFFHFLLRTLLYMIVAVTCWVLALSILTIQDGIIVQANQVEQQVSRWMESCEQENIFVFEQFPEHASYILLDSNGNTLSSMMPEDKIKIAKKLFYSEDSSSNYSQRINQYQKLIINEQICIVSYPIKAHFSNPSLEKIFPNVENFLILTLLLILLLAVILSIFQTSNKMLKEVLVLKKVAEEIQNQNLDFMIENTNIKEFNQVLQALHHMKLSLAQSLQEQWEMEQEKKKQMCSLAHDIKTPLTIIGGNAQLLLESNLEASDYEYATSIYQNSQHIQTYVYQIIELSKNNIREMKKVELKTEQLFQEIFHSAKALAELKQIQVIERIENVPSVFHANEEACYRIFANLFDNAVRFTPTSGTICCTVRSAQEQELSYLCVIIEDSGPGFSAEARRLAKNEFYQEDKSRSSRKHFGMGLFIAEQLITSMGGTLYLDNGKNGGACVTVKFPI